MPKGFPHWMTEEGIATFQKSYSKHGETYKDVCYVIANAVGKVYNSDDIAHDLVTVLWNGWIGCASAVLNNFGRETGLPISCNSTVMGDSIPQMYETLSELASLSQHGAGLACDFSQIRPQGSTISKGGVASGVAYPMKLAEMTAGFVSQNGSRPGAIAVYLDIEHDDILTLLENLKHLGGEQRLKLNCTAGVVVRDSFFEKLKKGDKQSQLVWGKLLEVQLTTGSPYIFFWDNVNKNRPQGYVDNDLYVNSSNLCTEITLHTSIEYTFVCCLCSLNFYLFDEWKYWIGVKTGMTVGQLAVYLLDTVLDEYIAKTEDIPELQKARNSVIQERAIGVGAMGFHGYLQRNNIPFHSERAERENDYMFSVLETQTEKASKELGRELGIPKWAHDKRNSHVRAIAPTRTNSVILGAVSEGINPIDSNVFEAKQATGNYIRKNPVLKEVLKIKGLDTLEIWQKILDKNGSVLWLDELTWEEKEVFFTAREIPTAAIIKLAAQRQKHIDQSQSLNRWVHPKTPPKVLSKQIISAWKQGVKTLYYTRSSSDVALFKVKDKAVILTKENCKWCDKAKALLTVLGVEYKEQIATSEQTAFTSFPQIWYEGYYIGGYEDLHTFMTSQSLDVEVKQKIKECLACQ